MSISQKLKMAKIGKSIFHSFQNIEQLLGQNKSALFNGGGVGMLLTRTGPNNIAKICKHQYEKLSTILSRSVIKLHSKLKEEI